MAEYDRPIWIHPARGASFADYRTEQTSQFEIWWTFGWPYETSVAMARIVFAGLFDRHPNLKIITHHMGGMIPYFEGRVGHGWDQLGTRSSDVDYKALLDKLERRPVDYFRLFYADTALFGAAAGTACGLSFFGWIASSSRRTRRSSPSGVYTSARPSRSSTGWTSPTTSERIYAGNALALLKLALSPLIRKLVPARLRQPRACDEGDQETAEAHGARGECELS
jgi:hypothetical protein